MRSSPPPLPARSAPWLSALLLAALLPGCGGSATETPFPQSPDEVSVYPTLKKPTRGGPKSSAARPAPPPPEEE